MARGEQIITSPEGEEYRILYTNRALAEAEKACGKPVMAVLQDLVEWFESAKATESLGTAGEISVTVLGNLLRTGLDAARMANREGGKGISLNTAYRIMDEVGTFEVIGPILLGILEALGLGDEAADDIDEDGDSGPNG